MTILSIDTSCDETAAAITKDCEILSNIIWSQAASHAKFGGVMPSLAQRMHEERIDFVVKKAIKSAFPNNPLPAFDILVEKIDAIAVTIGPGLSIALGVGVNKAKELSKKFDKKLIAVNHLEGHILSPLAKPKKVTVNKKEIDNSINIQFPCLGLVISGGNTQLIKVNKIGNYEILAETQDDALGEALDKGARMLGLGYPGGAVLEKFAKDGKVKSFTLPVPIVGQEKRMIFTYSGLKTAMLRLVEKEKPLNKDKIFDLAASFQDTAFIHIVRVLNHVLSTDEYKNTKTLLVGGGVGANVEIRKRLKKIGRDHKIEVLFPYSKKLYGDNAAMIGIAAYFKSTRNEFVLPELIDRNPRARINNP